MASSPDASLPGDAHGRIISLTPHGGDVIDSTFTAHIANEHRLLAGLDDDERATLERLLEKWGREIGA